MGTIVSYILPSNTGRTDDPDPVTGLTSREKYLVKTSWAKIMKNPTDSGVALLSLFFERYPQYLELFPFRDLSLSELSTSTRFRAHANSVVYALSSIVNALNENELLVQLLTKTGTSHVPRKATSDGFNHLKEVTVELFSTLFKPDEVAAWKKTLDVAFSVIIKGMESEKNTMGIVLSYIWGDTGRTDDPDPVTGLTSRDVHILKTTWKKISDGQANLATGIAIFLNLFKKHPQYLQLFPFRDVPMDELKDNNRFKVHCISLMYAFTSIVENIDNPLLLEQLVAKQGANHVPRKVPDQAYWELKAILLELFQQSMKEDEVKVWDKFLNLGFQIMVKSAQNYRRII